MESSKSDTTASQYTIEQTVQMYLDSLSPKERKAYEIAVNHLGSSFSLVKSLGYIKYTGNLRF